MAYSNKLKRFLAKLNARECQALFRYDSETGALYWRSSDDKLATQSPPSLRYNRVMIDGVSYGSAQIVWTLHHGEWPGRNLRRRDGDGHNDRIGNLFMGELDHRRSAPKGYKFGKLTAGGLIKEIGPFVSDEELQAAMQLAFGRADLVRVDEGSGEQLRQRLDPKYIHSVEFDADLAALLATMRGEDLV